MIQKEHRGVFAFAQVVKSVDGNAGILRKEIKLCLHSLKTDIESGLKW